MRNSLSRTLSRTAAAAALALPIAAAHAAGLTTLYEFTGGADGALPYRGPLLDSSGNIYGAASAGANVCPDSFQFSGIGCGTIYKLSGGTLTPLVTFLGASNGASPYGNLLLAGTKLYGTTYSGGKPDLGTVYGVTTSGTGLQRLHTFSGSDGANPDSVIRADSSGNGYSVTPYGGPGWTGSAASGFGVLFEITHSGGFEPLHDFSGGADGGEPGRVFLDGNGNIFGATEVGGGCASTPAGCGVVYEYTIKSGVFQVLYTFTGGSDSSEPALAGIDPAGNLLGYTPGGGANNDGTLFKLTKGASSYTYSKLWDFTGGGDGANPAGAPALLPGDSDSMVGVSLYGPVVNGNLAYGTLWEYKAGKVTNLYTFSGGGDGAYPEGTPTFDSSGNVYGTTTFGGIQPCNTSGGGLISVYGCGTIFKYSTK